METETSGRADHFVVSEGNVQSFFRPDEYSAVDPLEQLAIHKAKLNAAVYSSSRGEYERTVARRMERWENDLRPFDLCQIRIWSRDDVPDELEHVIDESPGWKTLGVFCGSHTSGQIVAAMFHKGARYRVMATRRDIDGVCYGVIQENQSGHVLVAESKNGAD